MKRIFAWALTVLMVATTLTLGGFSGYATGGEYTAASASGAPNIEDGVKDSCYNNSTKITFAPYADGTKNGSEVYFVTYGGDLYLYAYIKDTDGVRGTTDLGADDYKKQSFNTDCFEVYLNLNTYDNLGVDRNKYSCQLRVNPWYEVSAIEGYQYKDKLGMPVYLTSGPMADILGITTGKSKAVVTPRGNDYVVEMHLALDGYGSAKIGLGLQIQEGDGSNSTTHKKWEPIAYDVNYWHTKNHETLILQNYQQNSEAAKRDEASLSSYLASSQAMMELEQGTTSKKPSSPASPSSSATASLAGTPSAGVTSGETGSQAVLSGAVSSKSSSSDADAPDGTKDSATQVQNTDEEKDSGFPWWIVGVVAGVIRLVAAAVAAIVFLKKKEMTSSTDENSKDSENDGDSEGSDSSEDPQ